MQSSLTLIRDSGTNGRQVQLPNLSERSINDRCHYTAINSRLGETVCVRLPAVLPLLQKNKTDEPIEIRVELSDTKSEAEIVIVSLGEGKVSNANYAACIPDALSIPPLNRPTTADRAAQRGVRGSSNHLGE